MHMNVELMQFGNDRTQHACIEKVKCTWQYSSWDFSLPPNVWLMQLFSKLHAFIYIAVVPKDYML